MGKRRFIIIAGGRAHDHHLDVAVAASAEDTMRAAVTAFGGVHILVNNADIGDVGDLLETEEGDFERVVPVNVTGVVLWAHTVSCM